MFRDRERQPVPSRPTRELSGVDEVANMDREITYSSTNRLAQLRHWGIIGACAVIALASTFIVYDSLKFKPSDLYSEDPLLAMAAVFAITLPSAVVVVVASSAEWFINSRISR